MVIPGSGRQLRVWSSWKDAIKDDNYSLAERHAKWLDENCPACRYALDRSLLERRLAQGFDYDTVYELEEALSSLDGYVDGRSAWAQKETPRLIERANQLARKLSAPEPL